MQFVVIGVLGIGNGIKVFFSVPECRECNLLREFLDIEREKREYYEKLVLTRAGILKDENEEVLDISSMPSIRRATTLSHLRRMASSGSIRRDVEDKEAKEKFEKELARAK